MTRSDAFRAGWDAAARTRASQGLSETVSDPDAIAEIADQLRTADKKAEAA